MHLTRKSIVPLAIFLLIYLCINGYAFLRLGLHQDEILDFYGQANDTYIAGGRWATALYRSIFGLGVNAWSAPLMTGIWLTLALGVQLRLFHWQKSSEQLLYVLFYALSNQLAYILVYSVLSDALALGTLCATLSVYCIFKLKAPALLRGILATALLCFSLGTYQANALYFGVLILGYLLAEHLKGLSILRPRILLSIAAISIFSVALWFLVRNVTLGMASQEALDYTIDYQKGMSQWGIFLNLDWKARFLFVAYYIRITILEACGFIHPGQWLNILSPIALILLAIKILKTKRAWLGLALIVAICLLPYALTLALGTIQDPRAHVASGLSIAILTTFAWTQLSSTTQRKLLYVVSAILAFAFVKNLYWNSEKTKLENRYYETACNQLERMEALRQKLSLEQGVDLELAIFSDASQGESKKEFSQPSLGSNIPPVGVLDWYARHLDMPLIRSTNTEERAFYTEKMKNLQAWPSTESIHQTNKVLYIKTSGYFNRPDATKYTANSQ